MLFMLKAVMSGRGDELLDLAETQPLALAKSFDPTSRGAPMQSCLHVLVRGIIVFPLMLIYTAISLSVFRGKAVDLHY